MVHPGHHEQPGNLLRALKAVLLLDYGLVVINGFQRRHLWIAPTVINDQLPAPTTEGREIRVCTLRPAAIQDHLCPCQVAVVEIETERVVPWITEDEKL